MAATKRKKPKLTLLRIVFKDPDLPEEMRPFGEFGEYFSAKVKVDPKTGRGTIKFDRLGNDG